LPLISPRATVALRILTAGTFFGIARGSVQESVPLLELARRRGLLQADEHQILKARLQEIAKILSGLISGLEKRDD
jgi:four helix bundle protein